VLVTLGAIASYTLVAGASASVVRAAAMAGIVSVAREGGRGVRASSALAWAAVGLLFIEPRTVLDPGFQLSALATAGLIAWATPLTARLARLGGGRVVAPGWLTEGLGVSFAAQAATLPLVLALFGRLSLVAPAVNLAIVPLVPASMAAGLLALVAGLGTAAGIPDPVGNAVAVPAWLLLTAMIRIVDVAAALPFASLTIDPPGSYAAAAACLAIVGLAATRGHRLTSAVRGALRGRGGTRPATSRGAAERATLTVPAPASASQGRGPVPRRTPSSRRRPPALRRLQRTLLGLAVAGLAVSLLAAARPDGRTHLTMLDVGQGDAILIESAEGGRLLVDGGPDADRLLRILDRRLPPWDHRLDLVVLTHPHEDHVAGLPLVLGRYRIGHVFEPGFPGDGPGYTAFRETLRARGIRAETLHAGDGLRLDDVAIRVLWPDASSIPAEMPGTGRGVNDLSIVLLAEVDGQRILLDADAEDDVDPTLVRRGLSHVAVLKVAHHGSRTSTSDALLAAATPSVALISVGTGNDYGHPGPATLARLAEHGAQVHRTDLEGAVELTFRPGSLSVAPERSAGRPAALLYHPDDVGSRADRGRLPPALPRPAAVVPPAFTRRRRGGGLARRARCVDGPPLRSAARRGRGPPARRRQARGRARGTRAARRGVGGVARRPRPSRAGTGRQRACGHASARCPVVRAMAGRRFDRGAHRGLRGQAGRPAARVDGRAVRVVGAALPHRRQRRSRRR
jgi:competence protein ComEC